MSAQALIAAGLARGLSIDAILAAAQAARSAQSPKSQETPAVSTPLSLADGNTLGLLEA
jgi:hypothetical protein